MKLEHMQHARNSLSIIFSLSNIHTEILWRNIDPLLSFIILNWKYKNAKVRIEVVLNISILHTFPFEQHELNSLKSLYSASCIFTLFIMHEYYMLLKKKENRNPFKMRTFFLFVKNVNSGQMNFFLLSSKDTIIVCRREIS